MGLISTYFFLSSIVVVRQCIIQLVVALWWHWFSFLLPMLVVGWMFVFNLMKKTEILFPREFQILIKGCSLGELFLVLRGGDYFVIIFWHSHVRFRSFDLYKVLRAVFWVYFKSIQSKMIGKHWMKVTDHLENRKGLLFSLIYKSR